jgi:hypothetical protein
MAPIGGVRNRGSDADGFLAADPNLDTISSWSSGTPDAQWVCMVAFDFKLLEGVGWVEEGFLGEGSSAEDCKGIGRLRF